MSCRSEEIDKIVSLSAGGDDYITHKGKQIYKLAKFYENHGFTNVTVNIYDGSRHDVLLDRSKVKIADDIAEFINKNSYKETEFVKKEETKEDEYKVISLKNLEEATTTIIQDAKVIDFEEEEPEDDLRLSNELKK